MGIRVQMGKLPNGDYGLRVISADGATVIIDGTSNMFKIAASGTINLTGCDGTAAQCQATTFVDLNTGLTIVPAHHSYVQFSTDGVARALPRITTDNALPGGVRTQLAYNSKVQAGNQTRMTLSYFWQAEDGSAVTAQTRYYVMSEVAL